MIKIDEEALICDFAETYQIYDYRSLPARKAAILAVGLRDDSRIKIKMNGEKIPRNLFLQAVIADELNVICRLLSGTKKEFPSFVELLTGVRNENKAKKSDVICFDSPDDFLAAWKGGNK